jgi:hypothetical protein
MVEPRPASPAERSVGAQRREVVVEAVTYEAAVEQIDAQVGADERVMFYRVEDRG